MKPTTHLKLVIKTGEIGYLDESTVELLKTLGFKNLEFDEFKEQYQAVETLTEALLKNAKLAELKKTDSDWKEIINNCQTTKKEQTNIITFKTITHPEDPTKTLIVSKTGVIFDATKTPLQPGTEIKARLEQIPGTKPIDYKWNNDSLPIKEIRVKNQSLITTQTWPK